MKKLYFIALSLFTGLTVSEAQILTQANHAPVIGEMYRTTDVSSVGISPGSAGSSVTWDMSAISIGTTVSNNSVVAVPSASAAAYPSAGMSVQTGTANSLYSSSSSDLKFWGGDVIVNTFNINLNYSTAANLAAYSMIFGSTSSNTIAGNVALNTITGTFTGSCSINVDGSGILALPSRTFTNVMRLKTVQHFDITTSLGSATLTQESYDYYHSLSKSPLFSITNSTVSIPLLGPPSFQTVVKINSGF